MGHAARTSGPRAIDAYVQAENKVDDDDDSAGVLIQGALITPVAQTGPVTIRGHALDLRPD